MGLQMADIRECWEQIRPGLEVIKKRCDAEWRVEDVYSKCVAKEWALFVAPGVDGFLICWRYDSPYRLRRILIIECVFYAGSEDPFAVYEPLLDGLARDNGASEIEFRSPRLGFLRKGWKEADVVYRREVDHG